MAEFQFESIEAAAVTAYCMPLRRIKWDLAQADDALSGPSTNLANLIHAAAHLRLVIENTVFASLISNRQLLLNAVQSLTVKRDMGDTRKLIRKTNLHYWPQGVREPGPGSSLTLEPHSKSLPEADYSKAWSRLSAVLHGHNPYLQPKFGPDDTRAFELDLVARLHATLDFHFIYLPGNEILYARMASDPVSTQVLKVEDA